MYLNWSTTDDFLADPFGKSVVDLIGPPPFFEPAVSSCSSSPSIAPVPPQVVASQILKTPVNLANRTEVIRALETALPFVRDPVTGKFVIADQPATQQVTTETSRWPLFGNLATAAVALQTLARHAEGLDDIEPLDDSEQGCGHEPLILLIRANIHAIVSQFASGRPIAQLVATELASLKRYVGQLGVRTGLTDLDAACSIDDEEIYTNYKTLEALTNIFESEWQGVSSDPHFFAIDLRDLHRRFFAIVSCLEQLRTYVPPSVWATTELDTSPSVVAGDLWNSIRRYAGTTAPQLLRDGGKDALPAVKAAMIEYSHLLSTLFNGNVTPASPTTPSSTADFCAGVPSAFNEQKVQDVIHELLCHMQRVISATNTTP